MSKAPRGRSVFAGWAAGVGASYALAELGWQVWNGVSATSFYVTLCGPPAPFPELAGPPVLGLGVLPVLAILLLPLLLIAWKFSRSRLTLPFVVAVLAYPLGVFGLYLLLGPGPEEAAVAFHYRMGCAYTPVLLIAEVMMIGAMFAYWIVQRSPHELPPNLPG